MHFNAFMTSTTTLMACFKGKTLPGNLDWKVSKLPCSQYSMIMMIKSFAEWGVDYLRILVNSGQCWDGWVSSWCRFLDRCTSGGRVSFWCAVCWWSWPHKASLLFLDRDKVTLTCKHHLTEGALADRFYDLVVLLLQRFAHVLETLLLGAATLHTNNLFITRKQIANTHKGGNGEKSQGKKVKKAEMFVCLLYVQMSIIK